MHGNRHCGSIGSIAMQNQFDSIDLTDNAIARLEGFPKLHRLRTLLLSNNRISRIAPNLEGLVTPMLCVPILPVAFGQKFTSRCVTFITVPC